MSRHREGRRPEAISEFMRLLRRNSFCGWPHTIYCRGSIHRTRYNGLDESSPYIMTQSE